MSYEEIVKRTIPQLEVILARLGRHISLKIGVSAGMSGGGETMESIDDGSPRYIEDTANFVSLFSGIE